MSMCGASIRAKNSEKTTGNLQKEFLNLFNHRGHREHGVNELEIKVHSISRRKILFREGWGIL